MEKTDEHSNANKAHGVQNSEKDIVIPSYTNEDDRKSVTNGDDSKSVTNENDSKSVKNPTHDVQNNDNKNTVDDPGEYLGPIVCIDDFNVNTHSIFLLSRECIDYQVFYTLIS